jgi:hypothetical protein
MFPLLTVERRSRPRDWRAATLKAKPVVDAVPLQAETLNAADRALARRNTKEHVYCTARCWQWSGCLRACSTTVPPHASKRCPDRTDLQRRICHCAHENRAVCGMQLEDDSGRDESEVCESGLGYETLGPQAPTTRRHETDRGDAERQHPNADCPDQPADIRSSGLPRSRETVPWRQCPLGVARYSAPEPLKLSG